ncbi:MAG: DUF2490 domain-containing protein [Taibaiella sp.]|nr:DUF2490 domain-containing protein [Taibaiella sp.]
MNLKQILSGLLCLATSVGLAQNAPRSYFSRNSFWTETVLNGQIAGRFKYQLDYQYRRMSDASNVANGSNDPFKNKFQHVYRPWIHYQVNDKVRLSLSPIGFWETYSPAIESGGVKKIQPELRICPQVTISDKIGRVAIDHRFRFEYRMLGTKVTDVATGFGYGEGDDFQSAGHRLRFRYFLRALIPLGDHKSLEANTFYINTWNEFFAGLGHNVYSDKLLDQNRTFCLLGYKLRTKVPLRVEAGYGLQMVNRSVSTYNAANALVETNNSFEHNNICQLYLIVEDMNKIFKLKKDNPLSTK